MVAVRHVYNRLPQTGSKPNTSILRCGQVSAGNGSIWTLAPTDAIYAAMGQALAAGMTADLYILGVELG